MPLSPKQAKKLDDTIARLHADTEKEDRRFVRLCDAYDIHVPANHPTLGRYVRQEMN